SFGHALGSLFDIHHGLAVGIFIPYVFQFYHKVSDKYQTICQTLGVEGGSREESLAGLVRKVRTLFEELNVPLSLKQLGIPTDEFDRNMEKLVLYAFEDIDTFFSPRPITMAQCEDIFRYAYEGKDVDF
ncbi:MAG: iron-containing alcohol dehydrogenase, partial [Desulfobacteraceae bacterium]|nr:iron-containing alcohol dehydrogenase [Desulfobacteraceae bacterium]